MRNRFSDELTDRLELVKKRASTHTACAIDNLLGGRSTEYFYFGISEDDPSKISYLTKDRRSKLAYRQYWDNKKRYHTKIGKFIKKISNDELPNSVIEEISGIWNRLYNKKSTIVKIGNPSEIYDRRHCGCNSCMVMYGYAYRQLEDAGLCQIMYVENVNGEVISRSLLWKIDDKLYRDTIYNPSGAGGNAIKEYCYDNNIEYVGDHSLKIPFDLREDLGMPYMDNFRYFDDDGYLTMKGSSRKILYSFDSQSGGMNGQGRWSSAQQKRVSLLNGIRSSYHGGYIDKRDAIYLGSRSDWVLETHLVNDWQDKYRLKTDTVYSKHHDGYILRRQCKYCPYTEDYYLEEELVELDNGKLCFVEAVHTTKTGKNQFNKKYIKPEK